MSWRSFVLKWLFALATVMLSACVNAPTHPKALGVPAPNAPQLFPVDDETTKTLDCLSAEIRAAGADDERKKIRIALGALPNTVGPKVGRVDIPHSLQPFVRVALDRISSGIIIVDENNSSVEENNSGTAQRSSRSTTISADPRDVVQLRMNGSIYTAAPFRVFENELQALGIGTGTRVEAVDIGIQLFWHARVSPRTFQQSGSSVSMVIRLYSAEQGASAFLITSGQNGLVMARSRAAQEATPHRALQSAVNIAVGMLIKARASRDWGVASACQYTAAGTAIPIDPTPPFNPLISVRLVLHNNELCAVIKPIGQQLGRTPQPSAQPGSLSLEIIESRGEGIEIKRRTIRVASLPEIITSQRSTCLPRGAFDARAEQVEFFFKSPDGQSLGAGTFNF